MRLVRGLRPACSAADDLLEARHAVVRLELRLLALARASPKYQTFSDVERRPAGAWGRARTLSPRSQASISRAARLPWPTPTVTVRSAGTMSPPANIPGAPVISEGDTFTVPSRSNSTPGTSRRKPVSVSWPSARMTVSASSVSKRPVGCGKPELVELHHLDLQLLAPRTRLIVRSQLIRTPSRSASSASSSCAGICSRVRR